MLLFRGRERKRQIVSTDLFPKWLQQPELGQHEAKSQELLLYLPHGWKARSTWVIMCSFLGELAEAASEAEARLDPRHPDKDIRQRNSLHPSTQPRCLFLHQLHDHLDRIRCLISILQEPRTEELEGFCTLVQNQQILGLD